MCSPLRSSSPHRIFRQHTPPILNCGDVILCKPTHYRLDDGEWCEDGSGRRNPMRPTTLEAVSMIGSFPSAALKMRPMVPHLNQITIARKRNRKPVTVAK